MIFDTSDVVHDGVRYGIFGIAHEGHFERYQNMFHSYTGRPNWLCEQNLYHYIDTDVTETADFSLFSPWGLFEFGIRHRIESIGRMSLIPKALWRIYKYGLDVVEKEVESRRDEEMMKAIVAASQNPEFYKHAAVTQRSGYQAEFMRHWRKGEDKNIVVGGLHKPYIEHFLKNPIKDNSVLDLAREHVELAENNIEEYRVLLHDSKLKSQRLTSLGKCVFDVSVVASPFGGYLLQQYLR